MVKNSYITVLLTIIIVSCTNVGHIKNKEYSVHAIQYQLQFSKMINLPIDSQTSSLSPYIQHTDMDGQSLLITLNTYDNSLRIYNIDKQQEVKKIVYEKQGEDGVGTIQGFLYLHPDSIFIYTYWGRILYHTNDQGKVLNKYPFKDSIEKDYSVPAPYIQTSSPMSIINDEIILNGFIADESDSEEAINRPITTCYNIDTRRISYVNRYPKQYTEYHWGGGMLYRLVHYATNFNNEMVLSFAADHHIYVYSFNEKKIRDYYAGSAFIKDIASFNAPKGYSISGEMEWDWYLQNPSYEGIFHDPYQNVYYRIVRLPQKRSNDKNNLAIPKPLVVIILNDKYEYIGESMLPDGIDFLTNNCFVTQDGLNIQVFKDGDEEDENYITFYTYKLMIL